MKSGANKSRCHGDTPGKVRDAPLRHNMPSNTDSHLAEIYRKYIQAICDHDLDSIATFVADGVVHNGAVLGLQGYKDLLLKNIVETDVQVEIKRLIANDDHVAALLVFTTKTTTLELIGIKLDNHPFSYTENVIYDFRDDKIVEVHSLFDIDRIRAHALKA
ncbi:hypothetical protein LTR05_007262 [Lithohypha guttulata]|uniref:SnoaL-like domain-containing protein n=2 Tax=Lithohypha guttulata TaxID=1690604 RepID=A0AAN7YDT6_9EURO|nr:hypothetical protein LTR05_007262 [Lithohypha guttulata]